jgi:hypothetical protein
MRGRTARRSTCSARPNLDISSMCNGGQAPMQYRSRVSAVVFGIFLAASCKAAPMPQATAGTGSSGTGSSGSGSSGTGAVGAVGTRCRVAGDCAVGLECFSRFFKERGVCTRTCSVASDCGDGIQCVSGLLDYNSQPLPSRCVRPCSSQPDCASFGSDCDSVHAADPRYCF